jgi:hypothetical protein
MLTWATTAAKSASPISTSPVKLYVDKKPLDFQSKIMNKAYPTYLVQEHVMIPLRLFDEVLGNPIDLHLLPWKIAGIGAYSFKLGEAVTLRPEPAIGGSLPGGARLPIAPRLINGGFYLSAMPTLTLFGHNARWDNSTKSFYITRKVTE